jgi:shikimate kinase
MPRHLVLIGLSGSGKSIAGRLAAAELGAPFVDVDDELERMTGLSVAELFARNGEVWFRNEERARVALALAGPPSVVVPGGGWGANPENLAGARSTALIVYMMVDPATAALRLSAEQGTRPLLASASPEDALGRLLDARGPVYETAEARLETVGMTPRQVGRRLAALARSGGGW